MVSPPLSKAPLLFEEMLLHVIVIIAFLLPVGIALPLTWDFLHQPRCPLPQVPRGHRGVGGLWLRSKRGTLPFQREIGLSMRDYSFHFRFVPEKPSCSSLLSSWRFHVSRRSPIVGLLCDCHAACGSVLAWVAAAPAGKPFKPAAA